MNTLEQSVIGIKYCKEISNISKKAHLELCSARHVAKLPQLPDSKRDIPFENIQLFNCNALKLWALKYSIKWGNVWSVINILSNWMLNFCGMGKCQNMLICSSICLHISRGWILVYGTSWLILFIWFDLILVTDFGRTGLPTSVVKSKESTGSCHGWGRIPSRKIHCRPCGHDLQGYQWVIQIWLMCFIFILDLI